MTEEPTCANCGTPTSEDDLCPCEDFCGDCHEEGISPSCEDNERTAAVEDKERRSGTPST